MLTRSGYHESGVIYDASNLAKIIPNFATVAILPDRDIFDDHQSSRARQVISSMEGTILKVLRSFVVNVALTRKAGLRRPSLHCTRKLIDGPLVFTPFLPANEADVPEG